MKVGVIVFDESHLAQFNDRRYVDITSAWASVAGGQAFRIRDIHEDLDSDVTWWTNLIYHDFCDVQLNRNAGFKHEGWLRSTFMQLMSELGLNENGLDGERAAPILSSIAQRVVDFARQRYGVDRLPSQRLNEDIANRLLGTSSKLPSSQQSIIDSIAEHAYVATTLNTNATEHQPSMTLKRNRLRHARDVLKTTFPADEGWAVHEGSVTAHELEGLEKPFLIKCSITNVNPLVGEILSINGGSRTVREWFTNIEWNTLRDYADIRIHALIESTAQSPGLDTRLADHHLSELSFSEGLLAEQVWTGITTKRRAGLNRRFYGAAAAWTRSADRMIMFEYASKLHGCGITVSSYGLGNVTIRYPEEQLDRIIRIASDCGLLPPINVLSKWHRPTSERFSV